MAEEQSTIIGAGGETVEYRGVPGFPGYRVGSDGSVWTCWSRVGARGKGRRRMGELWKRMSPRRRRVSGYADVVIRGVGGPVHFRVHRLVLMSFVGPCPDGMQGCHENGVRADNRLSNVRWGTPIENAADKAKHGTATVGERNARHKLTDQDVIDMRAIYRSGCVSFQELGDQYGVTKSVAHKAVRGILWGHVA